MGDSKGPIRLKGLFVFGAVVLGLGYAVPVAGSAAGPSATLGAGSVTSLVGARPVAANPPPSAPVIGSPPRVVPGSFLVGFTHATLEVTTALGFSRRQVEDPNLRVGTGVVDQAGLPGVRIETVIRTYEDGFAVEDRIVAERVTAPIEEVVRIGTRPPDPPPAVVAAPPPQPSGVPAGARAIAGSATSYCLTGHTATGPLAGPGSIAVDPRVIPLGSHLFVTGYGYGWAVDTGSAIVGTLVDVWLDCDAAIRWGRRPVTIYVLPS